MSDKYLFGFGKKTTEPLDSEELVGGTGAAPDYNFTWGNMVLWIKNKLFGSATVWTSDNDGVDSGLDADKLQNETPATLRDRSTHTGDAPAVNVSINTNTLTDKTITNVQLLAQKVDANPADYIPQGEIDVAADFPELGTVQPGWLYVITSNVTDNDPTKTNTGQSFLEGVSIVWAADGSWLDLGSNYVTQDQKDKISTPNSLIATLSADAIQIDSVAGTLTIKANRQVDIYYNDSFHRHLEGSDYVVTLYNGSGYIYFDQSDKLIKASGVASTGSNIIIGVNIGGSVILNTKFYTVDGEVVTVATSESYIETAALKKTFGTKTAQGFLQLSTFNDVQVDTVLRTVTFNQGGQIDLYHNNTFNRLIPTSDLVLNLDVSVGFIYFDLDDDTYKQASVNNTDNKVIVGWYTPTEIFINAATYSEDGSKKHSAISEIELSELLNISGFNQALPDNQTSLERVYNAAMSYIDGDEAVIFPIITDIHASGDDAVWINHIDQVIDFDRFFNYDFIANLGDIGLDLVNTTTEDQAKDFMRDIAYRSNRFKGVTSWAHGNHDWNNVGDYLVTANEWKSRFTNQRNRIGNNYKTFGNSSCFDLPDKKVRVINLDTSHIYPYGFGIDDMQFFADSLTITESGWQIIILTHFCTNAIGAWVSIPYTPILYTTAFKNIIADFKSKSAGSFTTVSWDFTGNGSDVVVGNFSGDSHFDADTIDGGVVYTITQGYGGIPPADVPAWADRWTRPNPDTMLIDIVVVKPNQNEFKMFRLGVGDDRTFTY